MQINDQVIPILRNNNKIVGRLMGAFDRGERTIQSWIDEKDIRLTTAVALDIITEETGLSVDQILTKEEHEPTI